MTKYPYFKVLSYDDPEEREEWRSICNSFDDIDIFYLPEYVYLFEIKENGKAHCFVYFDDTGLVIYPFLKRKINDIILFNKIKPNIFDILSPYGYSGYLCSNDHIDMNSFYKCFKQYCQENNVVSEFVRFHPLTGNVADAPEEIIKHKINETIVVELGLSKDEIWKKITPTCRNKIKKAKKYDLKVVRDTTFENLDKFYELYKNTMSRLMAQDYYFFKLEWFNKLMELLPKNAVLFHVKYNDQIIMSGLFLLTQKYIHYYLSGSDYRMNYMAPNNLLLYEVALWAKDQGMQFFHLGGGFQQEDSLFKFKASFSPIRASFYVGNAIHNSENYQYLSALRMVAAREKKLDEIYFPTYRAPVAPDSSHPQIEGGTIIIGASGHARVCLDILRAQNKSIIGFCDDDPKLSGASLHEYQVLGGIKAIMPLIRVDKIDYIIGIGDNDDRKKIVSFLKNFIKKKPINLIHPSAIISPTTIIGYGNFIAPGVIINTDSKLGSYIIINTGATVDHDNVIHDFAQISPGCNLAGNVIIEEGAFLGTGAVVIPGITIGAYAIVGAGAVVIRDIPPYCTTVGVPARVISKKRDKLLVNK